MRERSRRWKWSELCLFVLPCLALGLVLWWPWGKFAFASQWATMKMTPELRLVGSMSFVAVPFLAYNIWLMSRQKWRWSEGVASVVILLILAAIITPVFCVARCPAWPMKPRATGSKAVRAVPTAQQPKQNSAR